MGRSEPSAPGGFHGLDEDDYATHTDDRQGCKGPARRAGKAEKHGDLKENAEYHAAREQQGFCEGRINEIESKLGAAQIIDITELTHTGKVIFGVTVTIIDVDTDEQKVYQIVGDDEANIKQGKLSVNSPIARGLIGREEGDVVQIDTPGGTREYEVDKVEHI